MKQGLTLKLSKKKKDEKKKEKNWVEKGDRLAARIAAECRINQNYIQKVVTKILAQNPRFDWEQGPDWKSLCEEVSTHPTETAFLEALQRETGIDVQAIMDLDNISTMHLQSKESQLDDMLRPSEDPCKMADLLRWIYEGDPSKTFNNKNKKDLDLMKQRALAHPDKLTFVAEGKCGNGHLKQYVNKIRVMDHVSSEDINDVLKDMDSPTSVVGEILPGGYVKALGGLEFPKAKRAAELIRLLNKTYKHKIVYDDDEKAKYLVFSHRASGNSGMVREIRENEDFFISPEGSMASWSVIGETGYSQKQGYSGPKPKRDIGRELERIPGKLVLKGEQLGKKALKKGGKLVLRELKKWWTGEDSDEERGGSRSATISATRRKLDRLRDDMLHDRITPYAYSRKKEALEEILSEED